MEVTMTPRTEAALMPDVADAEQARGYLGSAFRVAVEFVQQRGYGALVKQKVSPATAELIDKPPFPFAWMPATPMDELETALCAVGGRDACVDLGITAGRKLGGSVIQPVLKMATALFGNTPATVFQNLERFYSMVLKGMKFEYEAHGDREGTVRARVEGAAPPSALFDVTRGNLTYVFELCGVQGTVDAPEQVRSDDSGTEVRYRVRWS
jgi:hypothetical protein